MQTKVLIKPLKDFSMTFNIREMHCYIICINYLDTINIVSSMKGDINHKYLEKVIHERKYLKQQFTE